MKYQLYKDGFGWAVYEPNDGSIWHTHMKPQATEACLSDWADVLVEEMQNYHKILCDRDSERLVASSSNDRTERPEAK